MWQFLSGVREYFHRSSVRPFHTTCHGSGARSRSVSEFRLARLLVYVLMSAIVLFPYIICVFL